jgi:hypothetical protein
VIIKFIFGNAEFFRDYYLLKMSNFKENYKGGQNVKRVGNPPRSFLAQASPPMHNKYPNN